MSLGTLELAARELSKVLEPLADELSAAHLSDLLASLGLRFSDSALAQAPIAGPLNNARNAVANLPAQRAALENALSGDDALTIIEEGAALLQAIASLFSALDAFSNALGALPPTSVPGIDASSLNSFSSDLPSRLLAHAAIEYLRSRLPTFFGVLTFVGVIDNLPTLGDPDNPAKPNYMQRDLHLDRFPDLLKNPAGLLQTLYGWGNPTFNTQALLNRLAAFFFELGMGAKVDSPAPGQFMLESIFADIVPDKSATPDGLVVTLHAGVDDGTTTTFAITPNWIATIVAEGTFVPETELRIAPPSTLTLIPPVANFNGSLTSTLAWNGPPFVLLGIAGASRLEVATCSLSVGLAFNGDGSQSDGELRIEMKLGGGKAFIDTSKGDSFLTSLTGGLRGEVDFALSGSWTPAAGLSIDGTSGLEIAMPAHVNIGPASFDTLYLSAALKNGSIPVEISAAIAATLGPLEVSVDRIGIIAATTFPEDGGNLGPLNLAFEFKPPKGVALALDAGGFTGGGFLMLDYEKGEYAGALELDFQGMFSVKAIGIINTKLPDGLPAFSLLILISAEFTPIQLTFGFTLNGIGGIIGLNRRYAPNALIEGIRTNAIKSVLFPENVVANIVQIISDLKQFFPPQSGTFLVGPMAKIGWGTPSLITLELGLLLALPDPKIAIVGILKAVLPGDDLAILRLQVNFFGELNFVHGYIYFQAELFDSRLLSFSLTGSLAFLVSWGDHKTFAVSVGGFHPNYTEYPTVPQLPNAFHKMARLGISLLAGNPRLKVECYFAVTSNSVQFGARVELYAEAAGFNVYGYLGFDVLFMFDPFRFSIHFYAGIAFRYGTEVLAGIKISGRLSGPTPWNVHGSASITLLIIEVTVSFDETWGDSAPAVEVPTEDLLKLLLHEYGETRNWRADLPSNSHLHVTLKKIEAVAGEELLVIHPAGVLTFSQKALPLEDFTIEKYGRKKPLKENKFKLSNANSNGETIGADFQSIREEFAPGMYEDLNDIEKLSRPSFEKLASGFKLSATSNLVTSLPVSRDVVYELNYLRRKEGWGVLFAEFINLTKQAYVFLVKGSAVHKSALSLQQTRISLNAPAQVVLTPQSFVIANTSDLKVYEQSANGPLIFETQAEAYQQQKELIDHNPALAGQIQVVSHFELNQN